MPTWEQCHKKKSKVFFPTEIRQTNSNRSHKEMSFIALNLDNFKFYNIYRSVGKKCHSFFFFCSKEVSFSYQTFWNGKVVKTKHNLFSTGNGKIDSVFIKLSRILVWKWHSRVVGKSIKIVFKNVARVEFGKCHCNLIKYTIFYSQAVSDINS